MENQLRRSSVQPGLELLVGGFQKGSKFAADTQNDRFLPPGFDEFAGDQQQLVAAGDRFAVPVTVFQDAAKQGPQVVNQQ